MNSAHIGNLVVVNIQVSNSVKFQKATFNPSIDTIKAKKYCFLDWFKKAE